MSVQRSSKDVREPLEVAVRALTESLGPKARIEAPLGARTTYRVGGSATVSVQVDSTEDLVAVHRALVVARGPVPVLVLGQGSNLLVSDSGFRGVVVGLGESYDWIEIDEEANSVRAGAGTKLPVLARRTANAGFSGLEWAVGVPGSVGGALQMNAGGHGSDTKTVLECYCGFDLASGRQIEAPAARLLFGYRSSALGPGEVVLWGQFALARSAVETAQTEISEVVRWRREHQPGGSNAGSVFTNPPGDSAGRLVEYSGLKGLRLGTAAVSDKHANFIQADEGGSADDVRRLMEHVRAGVAERTGVNLATEVRLVGFEDAPPRTIVARSESQPQLKGETRIDPQPAEETEARAGTELDA